MPKFNGTIECDVCKKKFQGETIIGRDYPGGIAQGSETARSFDFHVQEKHKSLGARGTLSNEEGCEVGFVVSTIGGEIHLDQTTSPKRG